ncbi:MAG: alcohol dehydrogenase catalytic domain-containing protein [Candidatus Lokiarchaeota archaeon]|nr:alcohol dehydrogenase catalytic domain-containing protein [Candidatus Lokiarchaeota archaeon]MBD3199954.1 alcohol dehydrogenase catalytic domain-containing protein [Candidatus Lokiarchaeota archaeon]
MKAIELKARWDPKPNYSLGSKDIEGKLTYLGSQVWRGPEVNLVERNIPKLKSNEVLIKVKRCGICGSDVHMLQTDDNGYIYYPGLTAFPAILGHEFAGEIVDTGKNAINKRTNQPFEKGEPVTVEEMIWCGECRPCCDGFPNHCERLQEIGFSIDGAYAEYIAVPAKLCWSLRKLKKKYDDIYKVGSLVEPTSVAYNAVIERGGGIKPGQNVVILGAGPIGIAAAKILKSAGAAICIVSEPEPNRASLAKTMGADYIINPQKENFVEKVKDYTDNEGAALYLEATGLPHIVSDDIQNAIWQCKSVNSTVVIVARAEQRMPVIGEYFQVKRANITGAQGHSGHGTFPNVINMMASGMDMNPLITKEIVIEEVPQYLEILQKDRENCKISVKIK